MFSCTENLLAIYGDVSERANPPALCDNVQCSCGRFAPEQHPSCFYGRHSHTLAFLSPTNIEYPPFPPLLLSPPPPHSFQGGGGNETRLNGTWDVALQNGEVIIVTHSYRVNIFGFLASDLLRPRDTGPGGGSTGNYGIQDQRAAMQWTARNIAVFGGDPKQVFIVGQSAGGNSVSQHLVRPKSWGLFSSAGMESGAFYDGVQTATPESQKPTWVKLVRQYPSSTVLCCTPYSVD